MNKTLEFDVVVVGSGAAGLTAALTASLKGMKTIVLESSQFFGGTTALSGGGVWVADNPYQKTIGVEDNANSAIEYIKNVMGDTYDDAKARAYVESAKEMLAFMEEHSHVQMQPSDVPDYEPHLAGASVGRCLLTADFEGLKLGEYFSKLRRPIKEMGLFGSMQISSLEAWQMLHWRSSFAGIITAVKALIRHGIGLLKAGRGTHLASGNALAGRLLLSAVEKGVSLFSDSRAQSLIISEGRVTGVKFLHNHQQCSVIARKGVILASGGFGANPELREKLNPSTRSGINFQPETCLGDGIKMGVEVGGIFQTDNAANAIYVPGSAVHESDGRIRKFPSLTMDRHYPGSIIVNADTGKRFLNEGFHYQSFGSVCAQQGVTKAWMIADSRFVRRYGIGMVKPWPFPTRQWLKNGYLVKAENAHDLAVKLQLPVDALERTISEFNLSSANGKDPEFNRGEDAYSKYMGDAEHQPNPSLTPLDNPPYYAIELLPSDLCTLAGLETNANAQVIDGKGEPIDGLYAAGIDANSVMRGHYPGGGTSLGPAMTFGYLAAIHLSEG